MTVHDLFSTATKKSLLLREDWMHKLFSNPKLDPIHKLVMVAFAFWYYPEHKEQGGNAPMDFSEFAVLVGTPEEEVREALLEMTKAGVLQIHDEHGHELKVVEHYTCQDCGHEWDEGDDRARWRAGLEARARENAESEGSAYEVALAEVRVNQLRRMTDYLKACEVLTMATIALPDYLVSAEEKIEHVEKITAFLPDDLLSYIQEEEHEPHDR